MRIVVAFALAALLQAGTARALVHPGHAAPPPATYEPGEVLVAVDGSNPMELGANGSFRATRGGLASVLALHGLDRWSPLGGPAAAPTAALRFFKLTSSRPGFDPIAAARDLSSTGAFRAVIPDYHVRLAITIPNDTYVLPEQWYVQSPSDADVDLPEAWDLEKGNASVVIGIADTGVDTGHPDLAAKIWTNPGEIAGNGIDDDGDGYIDDVNGWDFGNGDNDPNPEPVFDVDTGIDVGFHGTFVAGIAAAETNNNTGIAGAGWNCRILPLKVVNAAGDITTAALAEAFVYAAAHHVDVLNLSLGTPNQPGVAEYFQALVDMADSAGVTCVAAAGNDASDSLSYPAACEKVISVAAADRNNLRAEFSNWGSWIDVAAPGQEMWSTICRNYEIDEFSQVFYLYLWAWDGENPYMYGDGTSFSCPLVSGTCGLVRARYPWLHGAALEAHLIATGDAIAYDLPIGKKLNAFAALGPPAGVEAAPAAMALELAPIDPNPFRERATFRFRLPQAADGSLAIYDGQGRMVRRMVAGRLDPGNHRVEWDGASEDGHALASGVYFARLEALGQGVTRRIALIR